MNKQKLLQTLTNQPDCFFSLQQVISLITSIDSEEKESEIKNKNKIVQKLIKHIEENLKFTGQLINQENTKYSILGNRINIDSVELNQEFMFFKIREEIVTFFDKIDGDVEKNDSPEFVKSTDEPLSTFQPNESTDDTMMNFQPFVAGDQIKYNQ